MPSVINVPAVFLVSFALLAGFMEAYYNVNEILSTIMLNIIAVQGMNYLLRGPLIFPAQPRIPQTARLA